MKRLFEVIAEDEELLAINKPADLVCHPTKGDATSSLVGRLRLYLGPNRVLHLINRLDRETSGIVLIAKKDETARKLRRLWEAGAVIKEYLAIVHGHLPEAAGVVNAPLGPDAQSKVAIKNCVRSDGSSARTEFKVLTRFLRDQRPFSLLQVRPLTGRKHQIRIHLSHLGHPIVGDKLYGGDEDLYLALVENRLTAADRSRLMLPCHALHAASLRFPWRGGWSTLRTEPELWFKKFLESGVCRTRDEGYENVSATLRSQEDSPRPQNSESSLRQSVQRHGVLTAGQMGFPKESSESFRSKMFKKI